MARCKSQSVGIGLYEGGFNMSTKAIQSSRTAAKALAHTTRATEQMRMASDASHLAEDAIKAAISAACAAERASLSENGHRSDGSQMRKACKYVRAAAEEAVEHAKDAMRAESKDDTVGAVCSADLSIRAAQRACSLAAATSILSGKAREMASDQEITEPQLTTPERSTSGNRKEDMLLAAVRQAANYLVTYDSRIIAVFARMEDAFLLESELGDLDKARGATSGRCEVFDCHTGQRLGGYLITGGKLLVYLRDDRSDKRYGKRRR